MMEHSTGGCSGRVNAKPPPAIEQLEPETPISMEAVWAAVARQNGGMPGSPVGRFCDLDSPKEMLRVENDNLVLQCERLYAQVAELTEQWNAARRAAAESDSRCSAEAAAAQQDKSALQHALNEKEELKQQLASYQRKVGCGNEILQTPREWGPDYHQLQGLKGLGNGLHQHQHQQQQQQKQQQHFAQLPSPEVQAELEKLRKESEDLKHQLEAERQRNTHLSAQLSREASKWINELAAAHQVEARLKEEVKKALEEVQRVKAYRVASAGSVYSEGHISREPFRVPILTSPRGASPRPSMHGQQDGVVCHSPPMSHRALVVAGMQPAQTHSHGTFQSPQTIYPVAKAASGRARSPSLPLQQRPMQQHSLHSSPPAPMPPQPLSQFQQQAMQQAQPVQQSQPVQRLQQQQPMQQQPQSQPQQPQQPEAQQFHYQQHHMQQSPNLVPQLPSQQSAQLQSTQPQQQQQQQQQQHLAPATHRAVSPLPFSSSQLRASSRLSAHGLTSARGGGGGASNISAAAASAAPATAAVVTAPTVAVSGLATGPMSARAHQASSATVTYPSTSRQSPGPQSLYSLGAQIQTGQRPTLLGSSSTVRTSSWDPARSWKVQGASGQPGQQQLTQQQTQQHGIPTTPRVEMHHARQQLGNFRRGSAPLFGSPSLAVTSQLMSQI